MEGRLGSGVIVIWNVLGDIVYTNATPEDIYIDILKRTNIIGNLEMHTSQTIEWNNYSIFVDTIYLDDELYGIANIVYREDGIDYYRYLAYNDCMTDLYNRNFWEHMKSGDIQPLDCDCYTTILIDVDNLKNVNDEIGHGRGDCVLQKIAQAIKSSIRKTDIAIRYGGDEFIIILPAPYETFGPEKVINRIRAKVAKINIDESMQMSISAGYAMGKGWENLEDTANRADYEMFREKKAKKQLLTMLDNADINDIKRNVEYARERLNKAIELYSVDCLDSELLLKMSRELDELIKIYMGIIKDRNNRMD